MREVTAREWRQVTHTEPPEYGVSQVLECGCHREADTGAWNPCPMHEEDQHAHTM